MVAALFSGGQALALGCADIPDAKVDLSLDVYTANQSYGRLLPEFKSEELTEEKQQKLPIDRLVGKQLRLDDGRSQVWLALTRTGETEVTAVSGEKTEKLTVPEKLAGLDNNAYTGKLARTFFSLGISWRDFEAPQVPQVDLSQLPPSQTITTVAQTTLRLKGRPEVERVDTVEYACSSDASFVGDPKDLSSMVVLKGAIRARQLTSTTTTETTLLLSINDVVQQQSASLDEVATLLKDYPEASGLVQKLLKADPVATAAITPAQEADGSDPAKQPANVDAPVEQTAKLDEAAQQKDQSQIPIVAAPPALQAGSPPPEPSGPPPPGSPRWGPILGTIAAILSIVLLLLYHPRFTARRGRDTVAPAAQAGESSAETSAVSEVEDQQEAVVSKPEQDLVAAGARAEVAVSDDAGGATRTAGPDGDVQTVVVAKPIQPRPVQKLKVAAMAARIAPRVTAKPDEDAQAAADMAIDTSSKSLETRIAVLDSLRAETELFQEKLKEAVATAAADAADSEEIRQKLAAAESKLEEVTAARDKLQESDQDNRSKLNAATDEGRELKEMVVELRTRLAKANARIESSRSVIIELEDASKMAIELNADYRAKATDYVTENRAMRGRVALLEEALSERDKLLKSTNQTNEDISRALLDERAEKAALEEDFAALSRDHEALQQASETKLDKASTGAGQTELELRSAQKLIVVLESELERLNEEFKQAQLAQHEKQTENARLRVDNGVRVRLIENNVQELSAHIETMEQMLRENGLEVPKLSLTPLDQLDLDDEPERTAEVSAVFKSKSASNRIRASKRGDVLRFRLKR